ncbi:MAG: ParG [Solirubrobacterales bacterium]|jgi:predicted transcriptional regulator|nr:ParG [Solirubrobacterales bacterium]
MSVVVRIPEDLHDQVKRIAALQGRQSTDVLRDAWAQYLEAHRTDLAANLEQAAELLRNGDTQGLAELASSSVDARAAGAAEAARS